MHVNTIPTTWFGQDHYIIHHHTLISCVRVVVLCSTYSLSDSLLTSDTRLRTALCTKHAIKCDPVINPFLSEIYIVHHVTINTCDSNPVVFKGTSLVRCSVSGSTRHVGECTCV